MAEESAPDSKVLFRVVHDDGSVDVETLWATALGNDHYKLDNTPFYAYSVSWEDTVYAPVDSDERMPTFVRVATKSGNRTIRVAFDPTVQSGNVSDELLQALVALGCSYEGANPAYICLNVPPGVDLDGISAYLTERDATWEHADPTYEELYPDGA